MAETSIIIRTFNEEKHLGNLLDAIKKQSYTDWEVIVVDSGSTDKTLEIAESHKVQIIKIESRDFTFGYSLNMGCKASVGKYLVFASAHVLPTDTEWLSHLITSLQGEKVAMVYGRQQGNEESKFSERMDFRRIFGTSPSSDSTLLTYANNANAAIKKALWEEIPFDEYLFGLEDIDWARKVTEKGYLIRYEPKASVYHIHHEQWYQVLNRYRREAIAAVRIGLSRPPQAKLGVAWLFIYFFLDLLYSFPNYTDSRLEEIIKFRYYQWKGSRLGWSQGKGIDLQRERNSAFFPVQNWSVVIKGPHKAELEETALPEMKPGDVLVKVDYVGVCRTDLEVHEGTLGYYRDGVAKYPIIPGHEWAGTIVRIGSNNKFQERFRIGQRIVGECILSRDDAHRQEVGVINVNGAYSQYVVVPGDSLHKIPEGMDSKIAVLAEPLAVVLRALRRIESRIPVNSKIAVVGAGQIGNLCTQVLSLHGYAVTLFDRDARRLHMVGESVHHTSTTLTNMGDFDVIVEASGSSQALEQVLKESHVDATLLLLGFPYGDMQYNFEDFVGKEKVIVGSVGADEVDFDKALELLPKLDMKHFTEVVMPLQDFQKAWTTHKTFEHLKIILQP